MKLSSCLCRRDHPAPWKQKDREIKAIKGDIFIEFLYISVIQLSNIVSEVLFLNVLYLSLI